MFSALQSSAILPDNFPQSESPFRAEDLADAFNPSFRWGNSAKNLSAPHHRTCGEMVCQLSNPEDYLWQGFMDDASMPYDEQMADELDFNLANAFPEPDSISDSEPEVINEDDEVRTLNSVKMETDDVKVEEASTSASTSSTSLKGVSKIGNMTIIDIDGLNQEQVWKVFEFIYNSVHYGVRYKELTQRKAVIMITAGFQGMLRYWWDDLNEASKTFILQGGIPENFENVITLFFAAMVIQFLGSQQKIKDRYKEAFFIGKLCDLTKIKAYQQHMTHLMYQFPGGYFRAEYKQYYVNSFPSSFSNLVKEWIKSAGLQIDDQITLAQINAFIDEVTDLECARLRMKKEFKQVKGFNSSFCNKETKSKDFGCAAAEKKCSCKVKNRRNKYGKKYKYESKEDETSDSTSSESPTEVVSTFSYDTSSVMFNMVRKPYAFPKKAKVRAESSSSSLSTTSGSEESEPSWMKKRRPSTLNLSKKEQRDYRPLPLFSNMVEQAEEIAKTEEWHRMIHPGLRQNQGNLPSPVLQQTTSTDFAIPKTAAKPSPSIVEKQLEKERQDRYCAEEHQLKAIQAMFSALEQVNNKIEQLHKLVLNTQSQSAAIEAKVDQCHGELQYLIDKAAMSEIAKEPVSEWKLQRPVNTCQVIPFNEKEHVSYFSEVWIKLPKIPSFRVDALWDTGAALSYLNQELVPPQLRQKLRHGIPVSYANNSRGQINQTVQCQIALTNLKAQVTLYLHPNPNTDLTIGSDVISKLTPWAIQPTGLITFSFNSLPYTITTKPRGSFLVGGVMPKLPNPTKELQYQQWFDQAKAKWSSELKICEDQLAKQTSDNPLAFWEREEYWISLSVNPEPKGLKETHPGMSIEDANLCKIKIDQMLKDGLISPLNNPYACQAFYVNNHSEQKRGKKRLVINYKPINDWLEHKRFPLPLKDELLRRIKDCQNGVTVLTKEQVAEKELKYSEPYILPPANAKLQPMESASNWHTNALKEIAKLQYSIISRIDAMVKAKQSATPSTSATPPPTASQQLVPLKYNTSASSSILPRMFLALQSSAILPDNFPQSESPFRAEDLADAFNPSFRWGNSAKNLSAPHHRYTCGEMVCQLSNPEDYLWQGFMDDASMPYDEQMADELDFNLANAFPEPDSISDSEPEVINEDDEVRRLNPVKMEIDDVKVEEPSTSASTSSTSLKGVSKIGDMTIIDIDGLNQEQVWKVFEFIYNSVHYGVRYKELTQRKAMIMITAGFQGMLRYWWDDLNEASKTFILQGGILENFENVITLFFAAMVIQFLGSQQKIKDKYKEAFFRGKLCDLTKIKAYQQHMTHLMYQFPGGYFRVEYKQYYVNSFPSSFSNLVKERIKSAGLQIDDQITLAQINVFIDEVTDLECARLRMKKEFKQVKGFNSSFCNKETKSKDFGCAAAEKKCSCKVKNRGNKYEDETSDSTSSESPTEVVSTFFDDTSSVMFNMVRKPYAFPKKAKVRAESSSSSPSTTSGSEESEPSWMKKRRPSTLNLSKKEQRDYRPLPLFSNMVEQAEEIAKTEEWRRMIHPGLRQNQGNLPSPVLQQTASTDFAIPKTAAKPSPSVVEKQLEKERQDRYCTEEHQLKAIQAMFSALEQVNNKIEQLHKLVLNTQSQSAAIEAKVDQCHGELQYLIDKAAMSKIAKEPVSEWKLQRPVNTCQVIPFNEKEHVSYFSEVWIKLPKIPSFRVDALWDTGAALSYLNQELVPPQLRQKLRHGIPVSYANNSRGQINQTVQCQIALTNLKAQVTLYLHPNPNTDLTIGSDVISKLTPWAIQPTGLITFSFNSLPYTITTKPRGSFLVGGVMPKLPNPTKELQYQQWFDQAKAKWSSELKICEDQLAKQTSDNPLAFWEREEYWISLPGNPEPKGLKATHPGMSIEDANLCKIKIDQMLKDGLISPSNNPYACQAFYVNNHSEQKQGKKRLVINYKPINDWLEHKRFPLPLKDDLLRRIKDCQGSVMATRRTSKGNDGTKADRDLHHHNEETDFDLCQRDTEAVLFDTSARSSRRRTTERAQRKAHQSERTRREEEDFNDTSRKSKLGRDIINKG
ncbi:hypothetical protein L7F22_028999 [Adiantum nelumboides]|nr:hypothetical protein [Adiantum nelumboides]